MKNLSIALLFRDNQRVLTFWEKHWLSDMVAICGFERTQPPKALMAASKISGRMPL